MSAKSNVPTVPSDADRINAKTAAQLLKGLVFPDRAWKFEVEDAGQTQLAEIPALVINVLLDALSQVAEGRAISLVAIETELTTQQAAMILKVSRPFVVSLVEQGQLAARQVGNRLRLPLQDVLDYKTANGPKRSEQQPAGSTSK